MHEHISPLLGEHPRIVNIFFGPVTVHYREVSLYNKTKPAYSIRIFSMGCQTWYFILNVIICHFSGGGMVMWTTIHCFDFLCV